MWKKTKKRFKELELGNYAANPIKPIVQQSIKEKKDRDDPEYVVENETGDESDDTSEESVEKITKEGNDAAELVPKKKKNRPDWLVGRQGKTAASTETPVDPVTQSTVEELHTKIAQLESEMGAKLINVCATVSPLSVPKAPFYCYNRHTNGDVAVHV
ncbi:hypothetical protein ACET3Z_031590 [Daucus carota]